jgi:dynein heavy chain
MHKIKTIQKNYNDKTLLLETLEIEIKDCSDKMERAHKLMEGLKEENIRWVSEVERIAKETSSLVGDSLVVAGLISFGGFYNS